MKSVKLILIGFMGAGKTTVAQALAMQLGVPWIEMDLRVVQSSAYGSVSEIFGQEGEAHFRDLEQRQAEKLARTSDAVISTGGGVVIRPENIEALRQNGGKVIFLRTSFPAIRARLADAEDRPLFADKKAAKALYLERRSMYEAAADLIIDTDGYTPSQVVRQILFLLEDRDAELTGQMVSPVAPVTGSTQLCMIVGDPVAHSLSPKMHNAGYAATGLSEHFVYVAAQVAKGSLAPVVTGMRVMGFRGLTCTIPHKTDILPLLDHREPAVEALGAANTVVQRGGELYGHNTDWLGIVDALEKKLGEGVIEDATVGIIGAGGTARAAGYGARQRGAGTLHFFNRTIENAVGLAAEFEGEAWSLDGLLKKLPSCDIVIQTTSVGMAPHHDVSLVPKEALHGEQVVLDAVYTPFETRLLKDATAAGATIVRGAEMFLAQGLAQYQLYTDHIPPYEVMKQVVCRHFGVTAL